MSSRFVAAFGPAPEGHPASYGQQKRHAFDSGWYAASDGVSVNGCRYESEWAREAWYAGHCAYYRWLAEHRVRACDRQEPGRRDAA